MERPKMNGYYVSRSAKLLKRFDKTTDVVQKIFVARYGDEFGKHILKVARREFEAFIPRIPYISGNVPALRVFLIISAWELAVYWAMKKHGKTAEEAWDLCHAALQVRLKTVPKFVRVLARIYLFSNFAKKRARKIAVRSRRHPLGDFEFNFVEGDGLNFDWGIDYTGCSIYKFMRDEGADEFAPYACLSHIALSEAFGWGLMRTETLAEGDKRCDFRFKKGGETKISSAVIN